MTRVLALAILAASLFSAQSADAAYDPVGSGATVITFSRPFLSVLAAHHVRIGGLGGATVRGARATLPASGGEVDPRRGAGTVEGTGTLVFAAGTRKVKLRRITFKAKHAPLYAKVGGGQLKLAIAGGLRAERKGFGCAFAAVGLRLTAKVAQRLDKKLQLGRSLEAGEVIGRLTVVAQPTTVHLLATGRLTLTLASSFAEKLNSRFVSVNPISPAELSAGPSLSFPIGLESTLAPDGRDGLVKLGGSVELLQLGGAQYFWRELQLEPSAEDLASETDLEPSPPQAGRTPEAPLLMLPPGAQVSAVAGTRTIELRDQVALLPPSTAAALNAAFAGQQPLFAPGETVGTLSIGATAE